MGTTRDRERATMGRLRDYEHDIFVRCAHSKLNEWSTRPVEDTREFVTTGLRLGAAVPGAGRSFIDAGQPRAAAHRHGTERRARLLIMVS
jgi:hypothetical protein